MYVFMYVFMYACMMIKCGRIRLFMLWRYYTNVEVGLHSQDLMSSRS